MSNNTKSILSFFILFLIHSIAEARDYNLNCRAGGEDMGLSFRAKTNLITVGFSPGNKGTKQQPLKKGECSWVDRGIGEDEPVKFCHGNIDDIIFSYTGKKFSIRSQKAPYVRKVKLGGYFSLKVRNNNKGCLVVARVNSFDKAETTSGH